MRPEWWSLLALALLVAGAWALGGRVAGGAAMVACGVVCGVTSALVGSYDRS